MKQPTKKEINAHLAEILKEVVRPIPAKYSAGVKKYGGGLWQKNCLVLLDSEITDFNTYWPTLKKQVNDLVAATSWAVSNFKVFNDQENTIVETLRNALAPFLNRAEQEKKTKTTLV